MSNITPTFVPVSVASKELGLAEPYLRREAEEGRIPSLKVGHKQRRYNIDAVRAALLDRCQGRSFEPASV